MLWPQHWTRASRSVRERQAKLLRNSNNVTLRVNSLNYFLLQEYVLGYHQRCVRILPVMHKLSCYWRLMFHAVSLHVIFVGKWVKHRGSRLESLWWQILRLNIIGAVIELWTQQNYYIHYHPNLRLVSGWLTNHQPGVGNDHQIVEENSHMTRISFHRV